MSYEDKENPDDGDVYMTEEAKDDYLSIEEVGKNMADEKDKKEEAEMAAQEPEKEEKPNAEMAADEPEKEEDGKEEEMAADKAVYSLSEYLDVAVLLSFLEKETVQYREMKELEHANFDVNSVIGEIAKGKEANLKTITNGMLNHLKTLSKVAVNAVKENKKFADENVALKEFKTRVETEKKDFEVQSVLKEAFEAGMPKEQLQECEAKAKDFSLENIDQYKNMVKAKAFQYFGQRVDDKAQDDGFVKAAFPFNERKNSEPVLWK